MRVAVEALVDAADDDSATGGPDEARGIWPVVATVTADGYRGCPDERLGSAVGQVLADRKAGRTPGVIAR